MFKVLEWRFPRHGSARVSVVRRYLDHLADSYSISYQELKECSRDRFQILIDDRDLTLLCMVWSDDLPRFRIV